MFEVLKKYYVFMLILMVFSFLVPKDEYKVYIQFFIGMFMVVLFLEPLLELMYAEKWDALTDIFQTFQEYTKNIEKLNLGEENIFEHFFFEGEGQ